MISNDVLHQLTVEAGELSKAMGPAAPLVAQLARELLESRRTVEWYYATLHSRQRDGG